MLIHTAQVIPVQVYAAFGSPRTMGFSEISGSIKKAKGSRQVKRKLISLGRSHPLTFGQPTKEQIIASVI